MDRTVSFGYWLRRRRKALDLTQAQLAQRVSCSVDTIKKIEADARRPSKQLAKLLADQLLLPAEERASFLLAARAERSIERLTLADQPVDGTVALPAFLDPANESTPHPRPLFVDRRSKLGSLHAYLTAAMNAHGRVAFVTGEAGRGKTALMQEFAHRAQAAHSNLIVASGNCNAIAGAGDPYLPFRDVLSMLCGEVESKWATGMISREHARRLWDLLPETAQALVEEGPDLIGMFASGISLLNWAVQRATPRAAWVKRLHALIERDLAQRADLGQNSLFEQYTRFLHRLSARNPLLIMLDDLQWADNASLNLLFHLGRRISGSRILILGAYRPSDVELGRLAINSLEERTHPLKPVVDEFKINFGEIQIDTRWETSAEGRAFVDSLLDSEPNQLTEAFREALYQRTKGHPLFTVELLDDMQTRGDLVQDDAGRWVQGPELDWGAMPLRVEALIQRRLGRLAPGLRDLLSTASVEGEEFSVQVAAQVLNMDERSVFHLLDQELEKRHALVRATGESQAGNQVISHYRFSHGLFQEYLYGELSPGERRLLHGEVAWALENLVRGDEDAYLVSLAHHYAEAGEGKKTIHYSLKAGDRDRNLYAHQEAAIHYRRAIGILHEENQIREAARATMKLALNYNLGFEFERARQAYEDGFRLWQRAGEITADSPEPAGQTLRTNWHDPTDLDPASPGSLWSTSVTGQLFSGLVTIGPDLEVVPEIARSWEVLQDGRKYIFHLREDACWSDGRPVTAGDFAYSWIRTIDQATGANLAARLLYDIKGARAFHCGETTDADQVGVRALDDTTLEVELEVPAAYFIQLLAFPPTYPVPKWAIEAYGTKWTEPGKIVSNGPFQLRAWKRNELMVLERNLGYRGLHGNVAHIELDLCERPVDLITRYATGELDILHLWMLPPAMPGHTPNIALSSDLVEGQRLLAEAGYPGGKGFPEIELHTPIFHEHLAAPLIEQWRESLGLNVQVLGIAPDEFGARHHEANVFFGVFIADYPDPDSILRLWNEDDAYYFGWQNEVYDQLIEKARRLTDQEKRMQLYRQAEQILVDDVPILPLSYGRVHLLLKPWVKEYRMAMMKQQLWKDVVIEPH
jgi:ABC-type oligopeptide transport system substrate-binding subunit/transcriptional regulator with XRE-family HTH domain